MAQARLSGNTGEPAVNKESKSRLIRRNVGLVAARTAELDIEGVNDPRKGAVKVSVREALTGVLTGMVAGCKGLGELEDLTSWLGCGARKRLKLWRRLPDTTLRDLLMKLSPGDVRKLIRQGIRLAHRRKQLVHDVGLRVASLDGKGTATWLLDDPKAKQKYGQIQDGRAVVRTITACLCSVPGRPVLDAHPVPPETNEMGAFQGAVDALLKAYERLLFDVVMYDSGACSLENATYLRDKGLDYVLCLTDNQPTLRAEAERLLAKLPAEKCLAQTVDPDGGEVVTRRLFLTEAMAGWLEWTHLKTVIRVQSERYDKTTGKTAIDNRYYLTSLGADRVTPAQWLTLVRRRWAVENENHNTLDKILDEDDRPWILAPRGMVVVMLLRRLAYNILSLYRAVTLRSEASRTQAWTTLMRAIYASLLQATPAMVAELRPRTVATS